MKPVYNAYTVENYKKGAEDRAKWAQVGVVFPHKDGEGFDIVLTALPLNGRLSLRKPKPKAESKGGKSNPETDDDDHEGPKAWIEGARLRLTGRR
jgi:hypothetical protein